MTVLFINFKVILRLGSVSLRSSSERVWLTNVKLPGPLPYIFWTATAKSWQCGEKTVITQQSGLVLSFLPGGGWRQHVLHPWKEENLLQTRGQMRQIDVAASLVPRLIHAVGLPRNQKHKKCFFDCQRILCNMSMIFFERKSRTHKTILPVQLS